MGQAEPTAHAHLSQRLLIPVTMNLWCPRDAPCVGANSSAKVHRRWNPGRALHARAPLLGRVSAWREYTAPAGRCSHRCGRPAPLRIIGTPLSSKPGGSEWQTWSACCSEATCPSVVPRASGKRDLDNTRCRVRDLANTSRRVFVACETWSTRPAVPARLGQSRCMLEPPGNRGVAFHGPVGPSSPDKRAPRGTRSQRACRWGDEARCGEAIGVLKLPLRLTSPREPSTGHGRSLSDGVVRHRYGSDQPPTRSHGTGIVGHPQPTEWARSRPTAPDAARGRTAAFAECRRRSRGAASAHRRRTPQGAPGLRHLGCPGAVSHTHHRLAAPIDASLDGSLSARRLRCGWRRQPLPGTCDEGEPPSLRPRMHAGMRWLCASAGGGSRLRSCRGVPTRVD